MHLDSTFLDCSELVAFHVICMNVHSRCQARHICNCCVNARACIVPVIGAECQQLDGSAHPTFRPSSSLVSLPQWAAAEQWMFLQWHPLG